MNDRHSPPTREDVEIKRVLAEAHRAELVADVIKAVIKGAVAITFFILLYRVLIEMLRTADNERVGVVSELLKTLLSEEGLFSVFMSVVGWVGCIFFAVTTFSLIHWGRKRDARYDKTLTLTKGGRHELTADTSSRDA